MTELLESRRLELAYKLGATFDYQQKIIACMDRFRTVKKPRQAGMTTAFAIEALIDAIVYNNYVVAIVSPTKRQSDRMMRYVKQALRLLEKTEGYIVPTEKFTSEEVIFHHGSEIYSLPNNPAGIQGLAVNHGIIDEAGLLGEREGEEIIDAIVGSLAAKKGRLTVSGRPRGKRGLLWRYWDSSRPEYSEFTHFDLTWKDRARQDPDYGEEVEKHRKIFTKLQFGESYDAEFIDEGVLVYPHSLLQACMDLWNSKKYVVMPFDGKPTDGNQRFIGVDFGRKRNLTEIHVLQKEETGILRTLSMKSLTATNFEDQKKVIDDSIVRMRPTRVVVDERGMGLPLLDYLKRKHGENLILPLKMSNLQTKEKTILQLRNVMSDLKLAIPEDEELYDQLHSFQKEYTEAGNVKYSGKVDETDFKDDKVIALVAAVEASQSVPFGFNIF